MVYGFQINMIKSVAIMCLMGKSPHVFLKLYIIRLKVVHCCACQIPCLGPFNKQNIFLEFIFNCRIWENDTARRRNATTTLYFRILRK